MTVTLTKREAQICFAALAYYLTEDCPWMAEAVPDARPDLGSIEDLERNKRDVSAVKAKIRVDAGL